MVPSTTTANATADHSRLDPEIGLVSGVSRITLHEIGSVTGVGS